MDYPFWFFNSSYTELQIVNVTQLVKTYRHI